MIRKAEPKDRAQLVELFTELHRYHINLKPEYFKMPDKSYFEGEISSAMLSDDKEIWVNDDNGVNAFAIIRFTDVDRADRYPYKLCYIDIFGVKEELRGKGIGTGLIDRIKGRAKELGCRDLQLSFHAVNSGAEKFYKKMGFIFDSITAIQKLQKEREQENDSI